jgi:hypothetical protein
LTVPIFYIIMIKNFYPYLLNAMTGSSTQSPDAQREDGR